MNDTTMETVANHIEVALDTKMDSYENITLPEGTVYTLEWSPYMSGPSKLDAPISSLQFSGLKLCF